MWKFNNMSSGSTLWPPDVGHQQNSMLYPTSDNPYGCSLSANPSVPFPVVEAQDSFFHDFNSSFPLPLNQTLAFNPAIGFSGQASATEKKRFLVFDHSGDQTSLVYSSVANPFEGLNPALPASKATNAAYASNGHVSDEEEMHEDTEEIDALLYSDTEYIDDEEASTGHSPLDIEGEVADHISHFQVKRRRVGSAEFDASVMDTASSAIAPELNLAGDIGKVEGKARSRSRKKREKRERILETVSVLRRIIPGGKGKDTASVLDEAIQYLKSLKLRAKVMGATASTP